MQEQKNNTKNNYLCDKNTQKNWISCRQCISYKRFGGNSIFSKIASRFEEDLRIRSVFP